MRPDIVLIGYLANDIDRFASIKPFTVGESPFFHRGSLLSPTLNFFYWRTLGPRSYAEFGKQYVQAVRNAYADPAIMAKHLSDIETLIAKVRAIDAIPVFAILPFPAMWQANAASENGTPSSVRQLRNDVYGKIAATVRSLGVPVIEAQIIEDEMSASEFALNPMDNHPSEMVHRRWYSSPGERISKTEPIANKTQYACLRRALGKVCAVCTDPIPRRRVKEELPAIAIACRN